jgi:hypothetical protein
VNGEAASMTKPERVGKLNKKKAAKDSDMPKRPPSAYLIFMETFRKTFKEENPDVKGITAVSYYIHTSTKYGFFGSQEYWANIHVDADKTIVSKTIVSSSFILLLP